MKKIIVECNKIIESESFKLKLKEALSPKNDIVDISNDLNFDKELVKNFIIFCKKDLGINVPVIVHLVSKKTDGDFKTLAFYSIDKSESFIYCKGRALVDCLRSLAHELTHQKQDINGEIPEEDINDNNDGVDIENEANSRAGEIMRKFGRLYPIIYDI